MGFIVAVSAALFSMNSAFAGPGTTSGNVAAGQTDWSSTFNCTSCHGATPFTFYASPHNAANAGGIINHAEGQGMGASGPPTTAQYNDIAAYIASLTTATQSNAITYQGGAQSFGLANIYLNATYGDLSTLNTVTAPTLGTVSYNTGATTAIYTPAACKTGADTFTWYAGGSSTSDSSSLRTVNITISAPTAPTITSAASASGQQGVAFAGYTITAACATVFSATGLPAGLAINTATGVISGTPTTNGSFSVTIGAKNTAGGALGTKTLTLTILPPAPVVTSASSASGAVGVAFSYQITATNSPTSFSTGTLPAGLSVNASGLISGTPTASGTVAANVFATNSGGSGSLLVTFNIAVGAPAITSATSKSGQTGVALSYQITASNSPGSFTASPLPAGLTLNTTTGLISGTPTAVGTTVTAIGATNGTGTGSGSVTFSITLGPPVVTSSATAPGGAVGVAYAGYQVTATNTPTSYSASGLPAGLTINTSTGLISGTPTANGSFSATVNAINATATGSLAVSFAIAVGAPVITSANSASGAVGVAFSYQITATNAPSSFATGALPPGLSVNASGLISGTPTANGTFVSSVSATNGTGTGSSPFTFNIAIGAPVISSASSQSGQTGVALSYQITASNSPTSFSASALPAGLTIDTATGLISGTPTAVGSTFVTIGASNATGPGAGSVTFNITLGPPVVTSSTTAAGGSVGIAYGGYQVTATNSPTSYSASGLPAGLTINTATGLISGTPTANGTFSATVNAINATATGSQTVSFTIGVGVPAITSANTASGAVGVAFSYQITATNGPITFGTGALPPGLSVSASGLISGTPTANGTYVSSVSATNGTGTGSSPLTFNIAVAAPVISSATTQSGQTGVALSYQITASNSPSSFTASPLPAGLTLNAATGLISGTPTAVGTTVAAIGATNGTGTGSGSVTFSITLGPPVVTSSATAPGGAVGVAYAGYQVTATNTPTSYSASGLPAGLTINTSTGLISGTPTANGSFSATVNAINATATGSLAVSFAIAVGAPVITSASSSSSQSNYATSYQITATNTPTSFGATNLPAGLSVDTTTGLISGSATAPGSTLATVSATNATGTGSAPVTFIVSLGAPVITSASTAAAAGGSPFSYQITASNTPTAFNATGLPPGVTVNTATGLISGTPTVASPTTFNATISATNATGTTSAPLSIVVSLSAPTITSAGTASGTGGVAFSYQITASDLPTSFSATGLPAGVTINTATGLISGTPTATGPFAVNLGATNGVGTGNKALSLTIGVAIPAITSANTASGTEASAFSYQITATDLPTSYGATGLPAGLSVNAATGLVSGTPTVYGSFSANVTATNSAGTGNQALTITLAPATPVITSASSASGAVGIAFAGYQITATNSPTSFGAAPLPAGLSVNAAGLITGTPTASGPVATSISASNATGTGSATLNFTIAVGVPAITSAASQGGQTGVALTYQITATNGPTTYGASGLPAGLSINTATGLISGTPTGVGSTGATVTATNGTGTGSTTVTFNITLGTPVITSAATAPSGAVGIAYAGYQVTATNTPTSFTASGLPAGLTINASGLISGTPTANGTFSATVNAINATGTGSLSVSFAIAVGVPVITSATTASAPSNYATSYQITATNTPTSYGATGLPAGLTLNTATGLISGTPTTVGSTLVSLSATNGTGTGTASLTFNVTLGAPAITSASSAVGNGGTPFSYQITASNTPTSYAATGLPTGVTINTTTGLISGTPVLTATTAFNATISATNATGTTSGPLTILISLNAPVITSAAAASGTGGAPFSYQITATELPTGYSAAPLPAGLAINTTTGVISGTPTVSGTFGVTIGATNGVGTGTQTLTLSIGVAIPAITSANTATATGGQPFTYQITASDLPTSFGASNLPAGLAVNTTTGAITGAPSVSGSFSATITASNSAGTGSQALTITVGLTTPIVTSASSAAATSGQAFSYQITAANLPSSFSATGLPPGVTINTATGLISGTPLVAATATFSVTINATNTAGTGAKTLLITVTLNAPAITSATTLAATGGQPLSYQITASNQPTAFGATGLPAGVTVNTATGLVSGTPSATGSFAATVSATNATGTGSAALSITVTLVAPVITSAASASGMVAQPFNYQITASDLPSSYAATGLPPGVTVNTGTGLISGAPTNFGTYSATVSATNGSGTGSKTVTITVANAPPPVAAGKSMTVPYATATPIDLSTSITGVYASIAVATMPTHGLAVVSGTTVTYTPATGYFGPDSFTYTATGIGGTSPPATVSLTINNPGTPTAADKSVNTAFNTAVAINLATSVTGVSTSITVTSPPSSGTVVVSGYVVTYTPTTGFSGGDGFAYVANGPGGTSTPAFVSVTVGTLLAVAAPRTMNVPVNSQGSLDLASSISGSSITGIAIVTPPVHGTAGVNGTIVTYTPNPNYFGPDTFTYKAFGNAGASAPATITVAVIGRPDPTKDADVIGLTQAQTETARRFTMAQMSNFSARLESLHHVPIADEAVTPTTPGLVGKRASLAGYETASNTAAPAAAAQAAIPFGTNTASAAPQVSAAQAVGSVPGINSASATGANNTIVGAAMAGQSAIQNGSTPQTLDTNIHSLTSLNLASSTGAAYGRAGGASGVDYWTAGQADFGSRPGGNDGNGFDFRTDGLTLGADVRVNPDWVIGGGVGYGRDHTAIGTDGTYSHAQATAAALYASFQPTDRIFVDAVIGMGHLRFENARYVAPINLSASGSRSGSQYFASVSTGYEYSVDQVHITPYARLDLASDKLNQYSETGAAQFDLTYGQQTVPTTEGSLGLKFDTVRATSFGLEVPHLRLEYGHDFQSTRNSTVNYADLFGSGNYTLTGAQLGTNTVTLGIGSDFILGKGFTVGVEYQARRASGQENSQLMQVRLTKSDGDVIGMLGQLGDLANLSKPQDFRIDTAYTYDSNVTRAEGADRLSDQSALINVTKNLTFPLTDNTRVVVLGFAGAERFREYLGLSVLSAGAQGQLQYRPSGDFNAPTFALFAKGTGEEYESRLRDGERISVGASVREALTDRISAFAAVAYDQRYGRSQVFDDHDNSARVSLDYDLTNRSTLYFGSEYRRGDTVSTGRPSLQSLDLSNVLVVDDVFTDTKRYDYRFKAQTGIFTTGYNLSLGTKDSIDFSWRWVYTSPTGNLEYDAGPRIHYIDSSLSVVYLMRF